MDKITKFRIDPTGRIFGLSESGAMYELQKAGWIWICNSPEIPS